MKRIFRVIQFLCMAILFLSSPLSAMMIGMSTEELTRESEVVIRGEVAEVKSQWSEDGESIITRANVTIKNIIKGKLVSDTITVEYEGGELEEIGLWVEDVSPLETGEDVILFLKRSAESGKMGDAHSIVGSAQGQYRISKDGIAEKNGFSVISGESKIDNNLPVDELIDKIRRVK